MIAFLLLAADLSRIEAVMGPMPPRLKTPPIVEVINEVKLDGGLIRSQIVFIGRDQDRVRALQSQYVDIWVTAIVAQNPSITRIVGRTAAHAVLGLMNSTPFSPLTPPTEMVRLLRTMAFSSLDAIGSDCTPTSSGKPGVSHHDDIVGFKGIDHDLAR